MGGGSQRHGTSRSSQREGPVASDCEQKRSYLLPRQRQKRTDALTIFGSLVKQRFVNSALFSLAGSLLKRMKHYFQTSWQQHHVPRAKHVSASTSRSTGVGEEEIEEHFVSNKNPYMSHSAGCDLPRALLALDFNANANTRKRPNKKRPNGRTKRPVPGLVEKPRHKRLDNPKRLKCHGPGANSQGSKRMRCRLQKCSMSRRDDKVVLPKLAETDNQLSTGTREESTNDHEERQSQQIKFTKCSNFGEVFLTEKCFSASLSENDSPVARGLNSGAQAHMKRKKSTRLKPKPLFNVKDLKLKKDVRTDRQESKCLSRPLVPRDIRPKYESRNRVASSHPTEWQSGQSFNSNSENDNDWPSLAELERPKGLIKGAAEEAVTCKYASSGVRDAGTLLKDVISVESEGRAEEKESFNLSVQQKCTPNVSQKTWASVAAQSLPGTVRVTGDHRTSGKCQTPTSDTTENTQVCNSLSFVSLLKTRKPPMRSKLACSIRLSGDHSKIKEKPTLGKFMVERPESAKLLKTLTSKKKPYKHTGHKDHSEKIRSRKGEKPDKTQDNVTHLLGGQKPKGCWQQMWKVDEMPMVYSCATPPVIVLADQPVSESNNQESNVSVSESYNSKPNHSVAAVRTLGAVDIDSDPCTNACMLSDNVFTEARGNLHQESVVLSSTSVNSLEIKAEISAPVEAKSPKKVSLRYRALLCSDSSRALLCSDSSRALLCTDSSRLDAKTLTEMQTRNKKTNHLRHNKVATRERQRQQRQQRQTTHHDVLRFHTSTYAGDPSQRFQPELVTNRCPYWLRSMRASSGVHPISPSGNTQSSGEKVKEDVNAEVINMTKSTNLTPCRHSERLRAKAQSALLSTYLP